ncbi:MAG TPA: TIGR00366 family protein [Afipia sp.]
MDTKKGRSRGPIAKLAGRFVEVADRWFPDSYVFVLIGVMLVAFAAMLNGASALDVSKSFGDGFWTLIPFTMQMAYVAIGGYIVATSPPAASALRWLARLPLSGRSAIVFVGLLSIGLSLINWGLSLIFSGLLVRELARRQEVRLDYRAAGAAAYLGLGCGFTLGMTSSAAQLQANINSIPENLLPITGVISFTQTIFTWQNGVTIVVITVLSSLVCYLTAPTGDHIRTAEELNIDLTVEQSEPPLSAERPGDYLERSPLLTIPIAFLALGWVVQTFANGSPLTAMSNLNNYNFIFLLLGALLHWRPRNLLAAVSRAIPSLSGVLLQFPFYAGIAHILTGPRNTEGLTLSDNIAGLFVNTSADLTGFTLLVSLYSAFLGFFIPSAGGKWLIEAPYVATAANEVGAHLGWTVMVYNLSETLPNLLNPFWMLPLLGILGLKAKDIVGYTAIQFAVHFPVVLTLCALLMLTFTYHPPGMP